MSSHASSALFAHSLPPPHPLSEWEPLLKHLIDVAEGAAARAAAFDAGECAYIAGLLHDLGKAKDDFQKYIRGDPRHAPHAGEGAVYAAAHYRGLLGRMLAFCIAGHHAGLANGVTDGGGTTPLDARLTQAEEIALFDGLNAPPPPRALPGPMSKDWNEADQTFALSFFIRMLFSCLVDADFIATETFYADVEGKDVERGWQGELSALKAQLDSHIKTFAGAAGDVNELRAQVLAACRTKAAKAPGLFSLTVPTGGGKTLSSLAFALDHAAAHGLRRVIYVAPYTAIIEQTADVFRKALGDDDAVLEHHSNFDWDAAPDESKDDEGRDGLQKLRRAAENWDRPIVVTTAVQFFESLFANRPSRCRKLHNIAKSVIILDEAQSLPLRLLRPCLAAVKELARGYGASIVLCTATQPAVHKEEGFAAPEGLQGVHEIAPAPKTLYEKLKRVRVEALGVIGDDALAARLAAEERVLCIVNLRAHARELFERLPKDGAFHLTTLMTPDHRRAGLAHIRELLKNDQPVRLVATSLIEAGVDISFPAVYRAMTGVDSIAQAAGRCNREGEFGREGGRVYVFEPEGRKPPRDVAQLADAARGVLRDHAEDPLSLDAVRAYFAEVYWRRGDEQLDAVDVGGRHRGIMAAIEASRGWRDKPDFDFADISQAFRIIDSTMVPLIVPAFDAMPYGASKAHLGELQHAPRPSGACRRALQRASVQMPPRALSALIEAGAAEKVRHIEFGDQFVVLRNLDLYDPGAGLDWSDPTFMAASSQMV